MILLRVHIEHGHRDVGELDFPSAELELVLNQLVFLIQILEPLLGGFTGVVRAVGQPLFHA